MARCPRCGAPVAVAADRLPTCPACGLGTPRTAPRLPRAARLCVGSTAATVLVLVLGPLLVVATGPEVAGLPLTLLVVTTMLGGASGWVALLRRGRSQPWPRNGTAWVVAATALSSVLSAFAVLALGFFAMASSGWT